jgi:hypothetical protein
MKCPHCNGFVVAVVELGRGGLYAPATEVVEKCANCGRSPSVVPRVLTEAEQEALFATPEGKHDSALPTTTHERRMLARAGGRASGGGAR